MKKALWLTSFRPFGQSKSNDLIQNDFIDSVKNINDIDITFCPTQFDDTGVELFLKNKNVKYIFKNFPKKNLPKNKKYSNKIMLENALIEFINNKYDYLVFSTVDLKLPENAFEKILEIESNYFCGLIFPNILVKNQKIESINWPHYGIDLFIFKININHAKLLIKSVKNWEQYNWGIIDNFYVAICELLKIPIFNLYKQFSLLKYENNFNDFKEDRTWQIKNWNENQAYFINFLKENKLSKLYATGSYFFILYKIFRYSDLNFNLIVSYFKFYIFFSFKFFFRNIINLVKFTKKS